MKFNLILSCFVAILALVNPIQKVLIAPPPPARRPLPPPLRHNDSAPALACPRTGRILLEKLPERFTLAEAYTIGEAEGMDKRLVRRLIYKLNPLFIKRISHGEYQKNKPVTPQKV